MAKAMRYVLGSVVRETERAILISVMYCYDYESEKAAFMEAWLPKSQISVYHQFTDGDCATIWRVPLWLTEKKHIPICKKQIADMLIGKSA